jgi:hypothetical protein
MNTDELNMQIQQLRRAVPALEFPPPDCQFCGEPTNPVDDCFDCENCGLTWDREGRFLEPINRDVPRCGAEIKPWADNPKYAVIQGHTYCCVLDAGHGEGEHPRMTHRGYRVDKDYTLDDTHSWPVDPNNPRYPELEVVVKS